MAIVTKKKVAKEKKNVKEQPAVLEETKTKAKPKKTVKRKIAPKNPEITSKMQGGKNTARPPIVQTATVEPTQSKINTNTNIDINETNCITSDGITVTKISTNKESVSEKDFLEWHDAYHKDNINHVRTAYRPKAIYDFWQDVEKTHQNVRKFLGGASVTFKIELEKGYVCSAELTHIQPYLNYIKTYLPNYYKRFNLIDEDFVFEKFQNKLNNCQISKHILDYAKEMKLSSYNIQRINNYLANIGYYWRLANIKNVQNLFYVTFSTDPRAFVMLGGYNGDGGACFNGRVKFNFGNHEDTFMSIIHLEENLEYKIDPKKLHGRSLGFISHDNQAINLSNHYGILTKNPKTTKVIADLLISNKENEKAKIQSLKVNYFFDGGVPYTNGDQITHHKLIDPITLKPTTIKFECKYDTY